MRVPRPLKALMTSRPVVRRGNPSILPPASNRPDLGCHQKVLTVALYVSFTGTAAKIGLEIGF